MRFCTLGTLRNFSIFPAIFAVYGGIAQCATPDYFVIQSVTIRQISGPSVDRSVQKLKDESVQTQENLATQSLDGEFPGPLPLPSSAPLPGPVTLPTPGPTSFPHPVILPTPVSGGGGILAGLDIIGVGKELWSIIVANQPVINADINHYSALPPNTTADQMENWSDPIETEFQMVYTNMLGMDVVKFNYIISFQYGGSQNGLGKYVANVTVIPSQITVDWGYKVDAQVQNIPPTNLGSTQNPIAMIQVALKWTVTSDFNKEQDGASYFLDGNGRIIRE